MTTLDSDAACQAEAGTLYVLATPIGHLADLSPRAAALLSQVDLIAAEDTRVTRRLLEGRSARARLLSVNEHNESGRVEEILSALADGQSVALVSDAGTPLISDPGYRLVAAAQARGLRVSPVPGPCAAIAALSAAGLPTDRFWFEGFLPAKAQARRNRLSELTGQTATLVFYVPARDLPRVLADCCEVFGEDRPACLARELTKRHETIRHAPMGDLAEFVTADANQQRGEAVLVVAGAEVASPLVRVEALAAELAAALPPSRAAAILARLSGLKRREAWDRIEALSPSSGEEADR
ncbi:16S rRNA (cytidine(1402)-2'-O)-methyltransferase [Wenzhouxiangella marina]|nr:16S rRNA (cytidine(1402)-2'-O)-methyltransferase [Wenzhouxiangella marina]MBB6085627.1 16S rRNA (cytidine1402-2'-O)-methyltransferase [Wenzhouxiangella marina]